MPWFFPRLKSVPWYVSFLIMTLPVNDANGHTIHVCCLPPHHLFFQNIKPRILLRNGVFWHPFHISLHRCNKGWNLYFTAFNIQCLLSRFSFEIYDIKKNVSLFLSGRQRVLAEGMIEPLKPTRFHVAISSLVESRNVKICIERLHQRAT